MYCIINQFEALNLKEIRHSSISWVAILSILIMVILCSGCIGNSSSSSIGTSKINVNEYSRHIVPPVTTEQTYAEQIKTAIDYTNPTTRDYALKLINKGSSGAYNIDQICDVWEKVNERWTYVNDPQAENYFSPASRTINLGLKGDCDDFAILIASLVQAIGGTSRIKIAKSPDGGGHAYAEVHMTNNKVVLSILCKNIGQRYDCKSVHYSIDYESDGGESYWLNLDWSAKHPGGPYYEDTGSVIAYYPDGRWKKITHQ